MKILHLALQAPYNEGWGYQENLLTKYQVKLGHDVTLVTTCRMNKSDAQIETCDPVDYISPDGFRVIRLAEKRGYFNRLYKAFSLYDIYDLLKSISPDFIMVHGLGSFSVLQVKKYIKKCNPNCVVIADNHLDENNTSVLNGSGLKSMLYVVLWRYLNSRMRTVYKKVYGVSPRRTEFAHTLFKIPTNILDTLPAGADDDKIDFLNKAKVRAFIREKHCISNDDFLIVTGGKIDENKKIDSLMKAVINLKRNDVKLLVFGNCSDSIKNKIETIAQNESIRYIGWISSDKVYDYFLASDLIVFPGLHSVMWEQACATKTPCVFHRLDGFDHFDVGGNCIFIDDVSEMGIEKILNQLVFTEKYFLMKESSESEKTNVFLYSNIAKKALEASN